MGGPRTPPVTPKDSMENNLMMGDCLELMKSIQSGSVDMVLCDLPYGTTRNKWDSIIPLDQLWSEYLRVCSGAIVLTAQTPFDKILGSSNLEMLRYEWIWVKNIATGHLNANRMPMKKHENILVFYKSQPTYNPQFTSSKPYVNKRKKTNDSGSNYGEILRTDTVNDGKRNPVSVINCDREIGLHPTQKPIALMEYMISTYTNPGEIVLDNCMGSGTTGVACRNLGRRFIGIEKDEKYFEVAKKRIQNL